MTDEQRTALAREHLEKADTLIDKLVADGASELEGAKENVADVIGLLDELEFEEGNLVTEGQPLAVSSAEDEEQDEVEVSEEFREDAEEE